MMLFSEDLIGTFCSSIKSPKPIMQTMDTFNATRWIATISNITFVALVYTPLLSYHLYRFYQRRGEVFIAKRYPTLVIITTGIICVAVPFVGGLTLINNVSPADTTNPMLYTICQRANPVLFNTVSPTINTLLFCRLWLMFYDLNYSNSNINKKWKSYLDPSLVSKDFWLKNKTKLGSLRSTLKLSCFIICCTSIPALIYTQVHFPPPQKWRFFYTIPLHLCYMIAYLLLAIKAPRIYDLFHLCFELKLLVAILMLCSAILYGLAPLTNSSNPTVALIGKLIRSNMAIATYGFMGLTSTWFILRKTDRRFHKGYMIKKLERHNYLELQRVLLNGRNFELFAQHLAREFSIEIVLAFIEFVQFKHVLEDVFHVSAFVGVTIPQYDTVDDADESELYFNYRTCDITSNNVIPKSVVVYQADYGQKDPNDLKPFLRIAHALYQKYIKIGVELEINISSQSRQFYIHDMECSLEEFMEKQLNCDVPVEAVDLFEYFDGVIEEMYCLLTSICNRFLETDENVNIARMHLTQLDTNQIQNTFHGHKQNY
eukprot:286204_1